VKKRKQNVLPDLTLAYKGMIPWSAKEFYDVWAKYATKKGRIKNRQRINNLLARIFAEEYPNQIEFAAHLYRFRLMRRFIFKFGKRLIKDGFGAPQGESGFRNELMDVLYTLPYSKKEKEIDGQNTYDFLYSDVKSAALKRMNVYLN
jgi:hypothetical protein